MQLDKSCLWKVTGHIVSLLLSVVLTVFPFPSTHPGPCGIGRQLSRDMTAATPRPSSHGQPPLPGSAPSNTLLCSSWAAPYTSSNPAGLHGAKSAN